MVLVPGWASDYRIFDSLDLNFNYLIPFFCSPFDFERKLLKVIRDNKISRLSFFGWSLGGLLAANFSAKFPQIVDKLILVGIRNKYPAIQLAEIRNFLKRSKKGYLSRFYSQCFSNQKTSLKFRKGLMKDYLKDLDLSFLLEGLNYLEQTEIDVSGLRVLNQVVIIQGENDKIVPLAEVKDIKDNLPQAEFILVKGAGHAVFLEKDVAGYL